MKDIDVIWKLFEKCGDIRFYKVYKDIEQKDSEKR